MSAMPCHNPALKLSVIVLLSHSDRASAGCHAVATHRLTVIHWHLTGLIIVLAATAIPALGESPAHRVAAVLGLGEGATVACLAEEASQGVRVPREGVLSSSASAPAPHSVPAICVRM